MRPNPPKVVARCFGLSLIVAALAGCGGPVQPSSAPVATQTSRPATSGPQAVDGLLVATAGGIRLLDGTGSAQPFDTPIGPIGSVGAGAGSVFLAGGDAGGWYGPAARATGTTWTEIGLRRPPPDRPLVALGPDGIRFVQAVGELQAGAFEIVVSVLPSGAARSISVARGLDGPPIWLGPARVAVHVILADGRSGFAVADVGAATVADVATPGYVLSATAAGDRIATDDPLTGDLLVGDVAAWLADEPTALTRIPATDGSLDAVAIDGAGTRLAVVRRTDERTWIEILLVDGDGWRRSARVELPGPGSASIAWLR